MDDAPRSTLTFLRQPPSPRHGADPPRRFAAPGRRIPAYGNPVAHLFPSAGFGHPMPYDSVACIARKEGVEVARVRCINLTLHGFGGSIHRLILGQVGREVHRRSSERQWAPIPAVPSQIKSSRCKASPKYGTVLLGRLDTPSCSGQSAGIRLAGTGPG
jgi:hypothetical protein